ncbi:MAG: hypothetical protein WB992_18140 [Bryobacteraceae bacterium]
MPLNWWWTFSATWRRKVKTVNWTKAASSNDAALGVVWLNNVSSLSASYTYDAGLHPRSTTKPNNNADLNAAVTYGSEGRTLSTSRQVAPRSATMFR